MANELKMPQLGESIFEGKILEWLKEEGDQVNEYDVLLEVETDKVTTEVTSPFTGTLLKILVPAGETVAAGVVLAVIGAAEETVEAPQSEPATSIDPVEPAASSETRTSSVSPVAARMAEEHDLDLSGIKGSGPGARIMKEDVSSLINGSVAISDTGLVISPIVSQLLARHNLDITRIEGTGKGGRVTKLDVLRYIAHGGGKAGSLATKQPVAAPRRSAAPARGMVTALSSVRQSIAEHMVRSVQTSPHVTTVFEVDMSAVAAHRQAHKATFAERGVKLTYTPYFIQATATAMRDFPAANSRWDDGGLFVHETINVGMATALGDGGLIVPVIRNADTKNLFGLAQEVNDLADRARSKGLTPDDVTGATITVTNHGTSGSLFATPIINQPQAAIVGVGRIHDRVVAVDGAIMIRPMCYVGLTFDHRILDGEGADTVLAIIQRELESWNFTGF